MSSSQAHPSPPSSHHPTLPPLRSRCDAQTLRQLFVRLFQPDELLQWLPVKGRGFYQRLFPPLIVLWYFFFLRLGHRVTLNDVLIDAHHGGADRLSDSIPPLSQRLVSWATTSFSKARKRFPLAVMAQALPAQAQKIRAWAENLNWHGWNVFLLDGSTIRLRPLGDIPKHFPPHKNRRSDRQYWCLMRVVVAFCLHSAVLAGSAMGALGVGEQALACQLIRAAIPKSLFVGDRNFGIFRMVQAARQASAKILVRMTQARARKLAAAVKLSPGLDVPLRWEHSRHDQLEPQADTHPVEGRLIVARIQRKGFRTFDLYLFTTLDDAQLYPAAELVQLYGWRWQVELNLRYLKTEMALSALHSKSADMAQKEWLAGLMTYNLIRAAMMASAIQANLSVLELSFSAAKSHVTRWLIKHLQGPQASAHSWEILLQGIARSRQPRRSKQRPPEPRRKRQNTQSFPPLWGSREKARQQTIENRMKS